jgi:hypothetical protein
MGACEIVLLYISKVSYLTSLEPRFFTSIEHPVAMSKLLIGGPAEPPKQQGVDPPRRLEIHDFVNDEKSFSLYVQALRKFVVLTRQWQ